MTVEYVQVAVGVVRDTQGRILIAKRPEHLHQGGLWEFPGGKLEPDECIIAALTRELLEEVNVQVVSLRPLIEIPHVYADKAVLLHVWQVDRFSGEPIGREGQPVAWCDVEQLGEYEFPVANRPIVRALQLPTQYLITPSAEPAIFFDRLHAALQRGLGLVQLRRKDLSRDQYIGLAKQVLSVCRDKGVKLLLNGHPELLNEVDADGVHLPSERLMQCDQRPISVAKLLAASCHDVRQIHHANKIGVDFAVAGPVQATLSHPAASPLGWQAFAALCKAAQMPVFALGGVKPCDLSTAYAYGGQGVAGISAFW